jgi:hypothetical protein
MPRTPERRESYIGQSFGVLAMIIGVVLGIAGLTGNIEWLVASGTVTSRLINATPGALATSIGVLMLWRSTSRQATGLESDAQTLEHEPAGPRSRLSVDAVRRLQEEVERARTADKERSSGGVE